ncbi:MAG: hypothetical protein L0191_00265, partial [Acidobacteria bacterium]|nr:hypothetical protein [Acidobacteriota bacterium]
MTKAQLVDRIAKNAKVTKRAACDQRLERHSAGAAAFAIAARASPTCIHTPLKSTGRTCSEITAIAPL